MSEEQNVQQSSPNVNREVFKSLSKDDVDAVMLPLFIGTAAETHRIIYKTAVAYSAWRTTLKDPEISNEQDDRESAALRLAFDELVQEHFKDIPEDELEPMLINYLRFIYNYADRNRLREGNIPTTELKDLVNTIAAKDGARAGLIQPVTASTTGSNMDIRSRIRRNFRAAMGEPDSFTIILLNSLIVMRVKIPTPTDLIRLINNISTKLRQYGERFNVTSIHLERAGISQILVDFLLDRLTYHSVKDVIDPQELKEYILLNDLEHLAMALLTVSAPKGISYRAYCIANKCQHAETVLADPAAMVLTVEAAMPEERRKVLYQIVNEARKLSREELVKYAPVYLDEAGNPLDTTFSMDKTNARVNMGVPSLKDYFQCYDMIGRRINPELRELAVSFPNPELYKAKRKEYLSSIRGHEYIHWFRSIELLPAPDAENIEIETIIPDEDPEGFVDGLMDIFNDQEELYFDALTKLIKLQPRMTYTYVGVMHDACPSCKAKPEDEDKTRIPGFTPIDPIMTFFDRTRMMIGIRTDRTTTIEDNLS